MNSIKRMITPRSRAKEAKARGKEAVAALSQQVAVGSHGEVFDTEGVETGDVVLDAFPDERLAPGNADFANAQTQKDARQAVEFGPGKNFVVVAVRSEEHTSELQS